MRLTNSYHLSQPFIFVFPTSEMIRHAQFDNIHSAYHTIPLIYTCCALIGRHTSGAHSAYPCLSTASRWSLLAVFRIRGNG
jgi:hypothetical protein